MKIALLLIALVFFISCGGDKAKDSSGSKVVDPTTTPRPPIEDTQRVFSCPTDTYMKYSWHLHTLNNAFAKNYEILPNSDINISAAWQVTRGEGIKIAVIDANFEVGHEDIKDNIIDYYNVDNRNRDVSNKTDDPSHGTSCAGFASATINGKGTVGSAPESKLILIALWEDESDSATIYAFEYAKNHGAKVISCSWGTENVSEAVASEIESLYKDGIVVLFAVGNNSQNLDAWWINDESELPWVIGVGASNEKREVGFYSNYGKEVDILAPGGNIFESAGLVGLDDSGEKGNSGAQRGILNNNYAFVNGTSFSTPLASGVAALILSANPSLSPKEVRSILIKSADKIGDGNYNENGFDMRRAYGKINAGKAVNIAKALSH